MTDDPSLSDPLPSSLAPTPDASPAPARADGLRFVAQRRELLSEAHARPPIDVPSPAGVTRLMLTVPHPENGSDLAYEHLRRMCEDASSAVPLQGSKHHVFETGAIKVIWERHTEFYSLTFIREGLEDPSFQETPIDSVPPAWLAEQPGEILSATHLLTLPIDVYADPMAIARKTFGRDDFAAAKTASGQMTLAADFRPHADGFLRMLVFDMGSAPGFRGRVVQRLLELDAYRLAALMALPVARRLSGELDAIEDRLDGVLSRLASAPEMVTDKALLADLSKIAGEIEELDHQTSFRFSASHAYYRIVLERMERLREERIEGRQRISTFMDRRLAPAMRTCEAVEQRQQGLAIRAGRAAQLLRTRVNVAVEEQNAKFLASLDSRAEAQLRLQETVEGLSVVALTYYAVGLVGYLVEAANAAGIGISKPLAIGLAVPVIAGLTLLGLRRMRARMKNH